MELNFLIEYTSKPGETVYVSFPEGKDKEILSFNLAFKDLTSWQGSINMGSKHFQKKSRYNILVQDDSIGGVPEVLYCGSIKIKDNDTVNVYHKLNIGSKVINVRKTKPFKKVFNLVNSHIAKSHHSKKATHIFSISYPLLTPNIFVCLTGSAKTMNLFNDRDPLLFKKKKNNKGSIKLNLSNETFPIEFKIAFFDVDMKCIVAYEPGPNNIIDKQADKNKLQIFYIEPDCREFLWKGSGINVPVFSLRSNNTWGIGDFTTIKTLVDYAEMIGVKMIQLLPVNDTISTFSDADSYPYSAISSFALNPLYLDVAQIAQQQNTILLGDEIAASKRINELTFCDYESVIHLKIGVLKRIFEAVKNEFTFETDFALFFEENKEWLVSYAAFCVLRDNFKTTDRNRWGEYEIYDFEKIQDLVQPSGIFYYAVLFWYFVQYHLHGQLKNAGKYAHKKGIILKADLPIGVAKQSVDAWVNPAIFNLNMQAGAPPDAFSTLGQNWSFPTYNIGQMRQDDFDWFSRRMKCLQKYFDALRIDHVLGLFRIWSIPQNQVNGTMGVFVPAVPLAKSHFADEGLFFNEERLCSPFITEDVLNGIFGGDIGAIKTIFFAGLSLKKELNDQQKIEKYFIGNPEFKKYKQSLFDLVASVILLKDFKYEDGYHFRINVQQTISYNHLTETEKRCIDKLYHRYFFEMQNTLWEQEGTATLKMLTKETNMLLCAEDLGMVPSFTEKVLEDLDILSLQVQQMPKKADASFSDTNEATYGTVVMPATHDMAPIRLWWEQNKTTAQLFYNSILKESGNAPYFCEPWICKKIIELHLKSPGMWSVFLLQDLLAINGKVRRPNPAEERINDPANPKQIWNYRMHLTLEMMMQQDELNIEIKEMIAATGR